MTKNKKIPKVGISLLAYNQGRYIEAAINALKEQSFQDFEIYLVDDASDDGFTTEVLKKVEYEKITHRYFYEENLGSATRRLNQYKIMKNEYILDLCADDILAPDYLEKTVEFLDKHKDYGAVSVNIKTFEDDINNATGEHEYDASKMILPYVLARNQILGSSLERNIALQQSDLSGGFVRYNDWDRWISMLEAGWKIGLVPEFLFYYRQSPSSLSHSATIEDELEIRKKLLKKHKKSYQKYYDDVIINMEYAFLEMQEAKDWLDGQYHSLNKEIDRLNKENEELKHGMNKYKEVRENSFLRKIVRKVRNKIKKK